MRRHRILIIQSLLYLSSNKASQYHIAGKWPDLSESAKDVLEHMALALTAHVIYSEVLRNQYKPNPGDLYPCLEIFFEEFYLRLV